MFRHFRKATLAAALVATSLSVATSAEARDRYHRDRGGNDAAIAIGAGIIGLAIGAAIASDRNDDRYYRDRRYYPRGHYYDNRPHYRVQRNYPRQRYDRDRRWRDGRNYENRRYRDDRRYYRY